MVQNRDLVMSLHDGILGLAGRPIAISRAVNVPNAAGRYCPF